MPSKQRRKQWKSARAASFEVFKKKRLETSLPPNLAQLRIDDRKLSTADTTNMDNTDNTDNTDNESGTWFWNESANKTDSDTEEERNGNHENDLKRDESKTKEAASSETHKVEIKWNREREEKLCRGYRKGSRRTQMRKQKSARE